MPSLSAWRAVAQSRANDAWRRICEKPSSLVVKRGSATLAAQTVRVELTSVPSEVSGAGGSSSALRATVFGVRGHVSVANTDIKRDDIFALNGTRFRVVHVIEQTGEVQAYCEAMQ